MANGLYTAREIAVMTDDALDELLSHYSDTGNAEGVRLVQDEQRDRIAWLEEYREDEAEHEAEQDRQQIMHDEMINERLIEDGRWG